MSLWRCLTGRREKVPEPAPVPEHNETAMLIGETVAQVIPEYAIENTTIFDINILITRKPNMLSEITELHLKMRIDGNLCVQMMEWPDGGA